MACCGADLFEFCPLWVFNFENNEGCCMGSVGSPSPISPVSRVSERPLAPGATLLSVPEKKERPEPEFVVWFPNWFTGFLLIVLSLSVLVLKFWTWTLVNILPEVSWGASERGIRGGAWSLGWTPTVDVWSTAEGTVVFGVWNGCTVVGLRMASREASACVCRSPVLEPSCQLKGPGERVARVLLLVDMETRSRGVWLGWSSSAENTSPTGTNRISRTPEKGKQTVRGM